MQTFTVQLQAKQKKATFLIVGVLDEESDLVQMDVAPYDDVTFDLKGLSRVSSRGLRKWLGWLASIDKTKKFSMENCPKVMVVQANMVKGVIPGWIKLKSVELPFSCDRCQMPFSAPFQLPNDQTVPDDVTTKAPCPTCNKEAEIDAECETYFRFLGNR